MESERRAREVMLRVAEMEMEEGKGREANSGFNVSWRRHALSKREDEGLLSQIKMLGEAKKNVLSQGFVERTTMDEKVGGEGDPSCMPKRQKKGAEYRQDNINNLSDSWSL